MDRLSDRALFEAAAQLLDSDSDDMECSDSPWSDSDDEFDTVCISVACALVREDANRVPGYEHVVSRYNEQEFKRLFRLSRETFDCLSSRFSASAYYPSAVQGRQQISAQKTCLIALVYLGSQVSMYAIADKFNVTESSVHACVTRVVHFLHAISAVVISWPSSVEEVTRIKAGFLAKSGGKGPRNAIGCIDGSHIEIPTPSELAQSYFNRKKWPSIILQGICDDRNKFRNVFIGFPCSAHDARVLRESPFFERAAVECGENYILGDSAYPLLPWLMTPFRDNECTFPTWKRNFNRRHSQQRVAIENAFGLLKQRFRRLYFVDARTVEQSCFIVMAACVLHNFCNDERDFLQELTSLRRDDDVGNDASEGDFDWNQPGYAQALRDFIAKEQC
ncbi:hypothetical protein HPB48_002455 [Haemaphysalis longicornis]|uniref:DDE Tnp4 domain-containing protein n=1 Tax=Haemaphysalis longicornis TaxID=44386 RepID=A0A9J6FY22_HAELO|nr:hypothetical protein HPB48_002455 [Haemaphysalis longicornis]